MTWQTKAAIAGGAVLGVAAAGTAAGVLAMKPKHKHKVAIKKPAILSEVVYEQVTPAPKKWTSMDTHMLYADEENGKVASQLYEDSDRPTRSVVSRVNYDCRHLRSIWSNVLKSQRHRSCWTK